MSNDFVDAVKTNQAAFGLDLDADQILRLSGFYELILEHNPILHLVGPSTSEDFAIRHVLESLALLGHLPAGSRIADVGAGGGLPTIPCLLVRDDLAALLIESKEKKTKFLDLAVAELGLAGRAEVVNKQFQEADPGNCEYVTCRALDKFTERLPRLLKWAGRRKLLLFGGPNLGEALRNNKVRFSDQLMPLSEKRFLFTADG
jgi:16S rRNA (guanine527-N7)-methyltransferase